MIATIPNIKGSDLSPDLLRQVNINPEQIISITIQTETEDVLKASQDKRGKRRFNFLHTPKVPNINGATDIAKNHDKYLYDVTPNEKN
ncbi:hypothetical protein MTBBW1_1260026 [Desulfamplus magnetovallimortis]|uniref:Uncharacterized protein n=1 Tax=Desulfamplus magnetovallimortis TaxID=1246637 RepID=A0A1W1H6N8_9BACT|nr:hypothetical protein [Desulfamplus magnetovallimortis]SLM28104.1 hypothetical protein MTBBW1_1260026 [Desulfamplus magnetovallimortis]